MGRTRQKSGERVKVSGGAVAVGRQCDASLELNGKLIVEALTAKALKGDTAAVRTLVVVSEWAPAEVKAVAEERPAARTIGHVEDEPEWCATGGVEPE